MLTVHTISNAWNKSAYNAMKFVFFLILSKKDSSKGFVTKMFKAIYPTLEGTVFKKFEEIAKLLANFS